MIIEIAVFSLEAAIGAYEAGADRIELCSAPAEGGLTPSPAMMRLVRKYVPVPVHVMIRPREGDFLYTEKEFECMLLDVLAASAAGLDGVVAGILHEDGTVDAERMTVLTETAGDMNVTFHRAFDTTADQVAAMETIVSCGASRILTSGGKQKATDGIDRIRELVGHAGDRIIIMPGSGINDQNAKDLAENTGVQEIHLSARSIHPGSMVYRNREINMGGDFQVPEYDYLLPDTSMIRKLKNIFA